MIVVTTRFTVPEGSESDFEQRLRASAQLLERPPGLIRNELLRPCALRFEPQLGQFVPQPGRMFHYEVKSWWRSLQDFEDWAQTRQEPAAGASASFARQRAPRAAQETFIVPESLEVHEVFLESPRSGQR